MKSILALILIVSGAASLFGQDLIVTDKGDSLKCRITKIEKDLIYFSYRPAGNLMHTLIPAQQVQFHTRDYYDTEIAKKGELPSNSFDSRYRLTLYGGYSYNTGSIDMNIPSDLRNYLTGLRSGFLLGADACLFRGNFGYGAKFFLIKAANSTNQLAARDQEGKLRTSRAEDNVSTWFLGPMLSQRFYAGKSNNSIFASIAAGYVALHNDSYFTEPITTSGNTLGFSGDIGYEIAVSRSFGLAVQASYLYASLGTIRYETESGTREVNLGSNRAGLNHLVISLALRYNPAE